MPISPQEQPRDATLLEALRKLVAEQPAGSGQDGLPRVPRADASFARKLKLRLHSADKARILVTGQIGVGKSTELREFERQEKATGARGFTFIHCDLEKQMSPERCGALGVMLAIFRDAWNFHQILGRPQPSDRARQVSEWLVEWLGATSTATEYVFSFGGGKFPISKSDLGNLVSIVLGKAAQHQALLERRPDDGLLPDKLVAMCNNYIDYLQETTGRPVVLLVDHVDKVRDERAAQQVLVEAASHWGRLRAALVMTAPYEFTLGERRSSVEGYWNRPLMVYPEPIPDSPETGLVPDFYGWLRSAAGLEDALGDGELRRLAYFSGGVPRTFVLLLGAAVQHALAAGHTRVGPPHVRRAIHDAEADYQDYDDAALEAIASITETQQGLGAAHEVLRSPLGLLVHPQPDGGTSFHAHPLVERSLERWRVRRQLASAKAS